MRYHINPDTGEALVCSAKDVDSCLYGENTIHGFSRKEVRELYEQKQQDNLFSINMKKVNNNDEIFLSSNLGSARFINGDLNDPLARSILSSGLCGDLALAIHKKTGAKPYFLTFSTSVESFIEAYKSDPKNIFAATAHVVVESQEEGCFLDAYGQSSVEDLEENWDGANIVEGTPEMLEFFADAESAERLEKFADTAILLDKQGIQYDFNMDEYSDDYDEEE